MRAAAPRRTRPRHPDFQNEHKQSCASCKNRIKLQGNLRVIGPPDLTRHRVSDRNRALRRRISRRARRDVVPPGRGTHHAGVYRHVAAHDSKTRRGREMPAVPKYYSSHSSLYAPAPATVRVPCARAPCPTIAGSAERRTEQKKTTRGRASLLRRLRTVAGAGFGHQWRRSPPHFSA